MLHFGYIFRVDKTKKLMANKCAEKFLSTTHDAYKRPFINQFDYKGYVSQSFVYNADNYRPNIGTKKWFQDYRRSSVAEKTMENNRRSLQSPLRPTDFSNDPDRVLGKRKLHREALFPVIHNNSLYTLTNTKDNTYSSYMLDSTRHRDQYIDKTESNNVKIDTFYFPFPASETFLKRYVTSKYITDFPTNHTAATEFVVDKRRDKGRVNFKSLNVTY